MGWVVGDDRWGDGVRGKVWGDSGAEGERIVLGGEGWRERRGVEG